MDLTTIPVGEFLVELAAALGVGALVGIEREHRRDQTQVIAGVRTFPLFSVAGYLVALVAREIPAGESLVLAAGFVGMAAVAIAFLWVRHQMGVTGLTTPMAMIVTFLLGVLIAHGFVTHAIAVGVVTTFLLLTKDRLHTFAEVLRDDEIMGALQFISVVVILFPIVRALEPPVLGADWIGRGALVDPYRALLVVIFVSAISFASFVAMRVVGARRGVAVSGLLGGLVSSEATSVSLARYADESRAFVRPAVMGALLATTTMVVRNLAIAAFVDPSLAFLTAILPPLAAMTVAGVALAYWRYRAAMRKDRDRGEVRAPRVRSPFALGAGVRFAVLYIGLSVFAAVAQDALGPAGVLATAIGGFVSAGAAVASVATLYAQGGVGLEVAAVTAVLATAIGAGNKLIILRTANQEVFERARAPFLVLTAVGVLGLLYYLVA